MASPCFEKRIYVMDDLEYIIQQNKELKKAADDVMELKRCVRRYGLSIHEAWKSKESQGLEHAADKLSQMLDSISAELSEIAHDLLVISQEREADAGSVKKEEKNGRNKH